jgi:hypothetical protein
MDKASFKYVELTTVSVKQPYYTNGVSKKYQVEPVLDFELVPTNECRELMKRLDLLFRSTDRSGGFIVLARVLGTNGGGDDILRFPLRASDKLSFWIKLNNPNALNFDKLPTHDDLSGIYYFSNQQTDASALRDNLHLTNAPFGVSGVNDRMSKSAANYSFHHTAQVTAGAAIVKHILSGVEVLPDSIINRSGQSDLVFNLNTLPLGKCQLLISGSEIDEFYFVGSPAFQVFGIIELLLTDTLASNYRVVESDRSLTKTRPAYSILFLNRKTLWRYTIHLQPNSPLSLEMNALTAPDKADFLNRLNIVSNDMAITFTQTSASDKGIVFVSNRNLALQEKYVSSSSAKHEPLSLTLKKYIGVMAKEANVRSDLSYPQIGLIDATTPSVIYSDVFLTL